MKKFMTYLMAVVMFLSVLVTPSMQASAATTKVKDLYAKKDYNLTVLNKNYLYVCGKKVDMKNIPIIMRSGAYMGSVAKIFKNTDLQVGLVDTKEDGVGVIKLTYGDKTLIMREGTRTATLNGVETTLSAIPFRAYYYKSKATRWVVPLWSVCSKLGINYSRSSDGVIKISAKKTTASSPKKIVLCIDAGHGGYDSGAVGNNLREKDLTLKIVLEAKKYFDTNSRFQVYYTRINDTYPSLIARSDLANAKKADLFLCIHINYFSASSRGTETMYNPARLSATKKNNITSYQLATAMQAATCNATGFPNRGLVERTGLSVLNHTNMPACLIEYGFISNKTEATSMKNNTAKYGKALYNATLTFCKDKGLY